MRRFQSPLPAALLILAIRSLVVATCCSQVLSIICCSVSAHAQSTSTSSVVPQLVSFSGKATDAKGKVITGVVGVTLSIYKDQYDGAPLWIETQNAQADARGNYTVQLGATKPEGLPLELFASGEARWLGVRINGGEEQPRVLLLSVPYALKAADAQTLGGLPASAFVLAAPPPSSSFSTTGSATTSTPTVTPDLAGTGTQDYVPLWTDNAGTLGNSVLYQTGSGSTAKIGIGTTAPATKLDVSGQTTVRGALNMVATGAATASGGMNSQPIKLTASAFNSGTGTAAAQNFQWQAEPAGNDTATPSGTLNVLFGSGTTKPAETGLKIASNGRITFAAGQTFPGTGPGTITGVTAGTDLTGGGSSGTVTLNLDTTKVPRLAAANTFTGNQTINGNLSATGVLAGSSYEIGSNLFAFGSYSNQNAFLGFAGNTTTTGSFDTATGWQALLNNTTGLYNAAHGTEALQFNTTGSGNTAMGSQALQGNNVGNYNTASGAYALILNTTGNNNTAAGYQALYGDRKGSDNTASGYQAMYYTQASNNSAFGSQALMNNVSGTANTASGYQALYNNQASNNTAVGSQALLANTTGATNTATGAGALQSNTTGYQNAASGYQALYSNTTGYQNTASGYQALYSNVGPGNVVDVGIGNTADGYQALYANNTGSDNTATGYQALEGNTAGVANTADGYQALHSNASSQNTAVGFWALYANTDGIANTAVGMFALEANIDGAANTAVGWYALAADTGGGNTAFGYNALASNTSGTENTAVGAGAGSSNTTDSDLTCIGYNACAPSHDALSNATAIGAHAVVGQSNSLVLGGTDQWAVKVGIGTAEPSNVLTIGRGLGHPVSDSWETYSSRRWKTNIHTLNGALGKVEQLRGVSYDLKDSGKHEIGVIAEEVGTVVPEVVTYEKNGTDAQGVDYGRLTALLIEAVKQQQKQIAAQREQIRRLRSRDALLQSKLTQLQGKVDELRQAKTPASAIARNSPAALTLKAQP